MLNAVITGIGGFQNRGVEALLVPSVDQLYQRGFSVTVLTKTPAYDEMWLQGQNIKLVDEGMLYQQVYPGKIRNLLVKYSAGLQKPPVHPDYETVLQIIRGASLVISSGGDNFSSEYGFDTIQKHLHPLELAVNEGVPIIFLAQSIGPFTSNSEAEAWLGVARHSKLITVREDLTYNYLINDLGLTTNVVKRTADPAFLLQPPPRESIKKMLISCGLTEDRPIVAIAASQGISSFSGCDSQKHMNAWQQVIEMIINELEAQVLLIPHVQKTSPHNDDRILATNLLKAFNFDHRVRLAGAVHSASEFKGLISACDLLIAERMHAAIAGISSGICTVAVGYSIKAEGIMTDMLGANPTDQGLLVSVQEFLDAKRACTIVQGAWNKRLIVSNQFKERLPQARVKATMNFDLITQLFC